MRSRGHRDSPLFLPQQRAAKSVGRQTSSGLFWSNADEKGSTEKRKKTVWFIKFGHRLESINSRKAARGSRKFKGAVFEIEILCCFIYCFRCCPVCSATPKFHSTLFLFLISLHISFPSRSRNEALSHHR